MARRNNNPVFARMPSRRRRGLQPFAAVFEQMFLPYLWQHGTALGEDEVARLSGRLRRRLRIDCGYPVDPALTCYALRLCGHYHLSAIQRNCGTAELTEQRELIDRAYGVITQLEEFFGTYRLRLLLA
jgi:hypothetical protein